MFYNHIAELAIKIKRINVNSTTEASGMALCALSEILNVKSHEDGLGDILLPPWRLKKT